MNTLIIDIENTLITKVELNSMAEIEAIKQIENYKSEYIILNNSDEPCKCEHISFCQCFFKNLVFNIRPYAFEFMRAVSHFYEIMVYSRFNED